MSHINCINQIRPNSTFDNFEIYQEEQLTAVMAMKQLAQQIVNNAQRIHGQEYPFPFGKVIFLWSEPGHGKSHLLESFAAYILAEAPQLAASLYLSRDNFTLRHIASTDLYDKCPIVMIDDLFSEEQSVKDLHPATDLPCLMKYLAAVYERRTLVIATSNFQMLGNHGIIERIRSVDKVGRILSRCEELLSSSGEVYLPGKDFRKVIAERRRGNSPTHQDLFSK